MHKATVYTINGMEIEIEYDYIGENATTIAFYSSEHCYTKFSKFNVIVWMVKEKEQETDDNDG